MGVIEASDRAWRVVQMKSEKQGVSAWLRGIIGECGVSGTRSCTAIAEAFGIDCKHERTCRDCITKMMTAIADRIDAERALPEGVEWPRFEDGGLVRIGDELEFEGKTMLVCDATFYADGWALWCDREDMSGRLYGKYGERVKRPAPKVLDADGVPIKVDDTVYFVNGNGRALIVERIDANGGEPAVDLVYTGERIHWHSANPEKLTHECPDSWEQLSNDTRMGAVTYAEKILGVDITETTTEDDYDAFARDIVRRAKALAKAASEARGWSDGRPEKRNRAPQAGESAHERGERHHERPHLEAQGARRGERRAEGQA